ncbi:MAG TPA: arylesterase [Parvularculaceae bacterium]|nr:arylesterase [Parvularculaceae bacterium]
MRNNDAITPARSTAHKTQRLAVIAALMLLLAACGGPGDNAESAAANAAAPNTTEHRAPFRLIMLGDSIAAGYGLAADQALPARLEAALRARGLAVNIINAGVSGDTTSDALARLDWALGTGADGVLIELGGNDLLQGVDPQTTKANLKAIIERVKAQGLFVLLVGMRAPGNYGAAFAKDFDAIYPALAEGEGIPLYPFLLEGVATTPSLSQRDGIHPNKDGVNKIVSNLAPFIENAIEKDGRGDLR